MNELTFNPGVYRTGRSDGLVSLLERIWLREKFLGKGTIYIVSGFANYNGGVRFFPFFARHVESGGQVVAVFAGSSNQNLTSQQVVRELLGCGADVHIVNRKRPMHAKCYGSKSGKGELAVVTSGNFTGPGMAQNVEMAVLLDQSTTRDMGFSWEAMVDKMLRQPWDIQTASLGQPLSAPVWQLLYDEEASRIPLDGAGETTMVVILGHSDTARINAKPGSNQAQGTQYFWLSRDCYDFFPALTLLNKRGEKRTYSCLIQMYFIDLGREEEIRVTFEAENNSDFRLGTGPLRHTGRAKRRDIAAISRVGESRYELRLHRQGTETYRPVLAYAVNFVGHRGKQYGFLSNQEFGRILESTART